MAIKGSYTTKDGVVHSECYANVKRAKEIDYNQKRASVFVTLFASKELKDAGNSPTDFKMLDIASDKFDAIFVGKDWRVGIYEYLKTLDQFKDWIDA